MSLKFSLLFIFLLLPTFSFATDGTLTIGCTTKCSWFYRHALRNTAKQHNQKIKILDLSKQEAINWNELDGILIPGGADINPEYYFPSIEPELVEYTKKLDYLVNYSAEGRRRDPFEFGILKEYFSNENYKDIPILGICRGMQMLAVSQGIPLYVDIKKELGIRNRRYLFDRITLTGERDSLMGQMFKHSFLGFKQHHQGIRVAYYMEHQERWPHIALTSYSNRGRIAESMEFRNRPVLGVQFHSEKDFGFERHSIFSWFLDKAEEKHLTEH